LELAAAEAQGATVSYAEQDYPFRSVSNALRYGYNGEAKQLCRGSAIASLYRPPAGDIYSEPEQTPTPYWHGASALDRAAEAGKVVGLVRRTLFAPVLTAVEAYYLPADLSRPDILFRKHHHCSQLIPFVRKNVKGSPDGKVLELAISVWAGLIENPKRDDAKDAGVSVRTVERLKSKRIGYVRDAEGLLNEYLDSARRQLGEPMRAYGLIP
jgi:hypothetical protein